MIFSLIHLPREMFGRCLFPILFLIGWSLAFNSFGTSSHWSESKASSYQEGTAPGFYMGRKIARTMHWRGADWLVRGTRESEENTSMMLEQLQIKPGQVVCDLGSGNGYHTLKIARLVGAAGRVIATDIQPQMLEMLSERARLASIANIEMIESEIDDPNLPESQIDLVLMADVYHEFSFPAEILQKVHASLKAQGVVALLEFRGEDSRVPIKPLHKMSKEQIRLELEANGFRLIRSFDGLPWQHLMFFEKLARE